MNDENDQIPMQLPESIRAWEWAAKSRGVLKKSVLDLESYQSGSKLNYSQYIALRAFWVVIDRDDFDTPTHRDNWFSHFEQAQETLNGVNDPRSKQYSLLLGNCL